MDENVLKMVASIKGKSGKKSDEMLVDLLSKMSEAYSESKNENKELNKVILELKEKMDIMEAENKNLKEELEKMKKEENKFKNVKYVMKTIEPPLPKPEVPKIEPVPLPPPKEDQHRSIRYGFT